MANVVDKARATGNEAIMVCERGVSFGYNNLVSDMRALAIMRDTGAPVVFDATHSAQLPGEGHGLRGHAGGHTRAGTGGGSRGVSGLFMETHPDPEKALSDGPGTAGPWGSSSLLETLLELDRVVKQPFAEMLLSLGLS